MDDQENKRENIFQKALRAGEAWFDSQIRKAQEDVVIKVDEDEGDYFYRKSVSKDVSYYVGSQGYQDKPYRLTFEHLKQMSLKDSIVSAIIQTRQNQIASYSKPVTTQFEKGFRIKFRDEEEEIRKIVEQLRKEGEENLKKSKKRKVLEQLKKAENPEEEDQLDTEEMELPEDETQENSQEGSKDSQDDLNEDGELSEWELQRKARRMLEEKTSAKRKEIRDFIVNCGKTKDRPFESEKWTFESILRALVRDSLTYDQLACEIIPDKANRPHHFVPVDGSTIRFASPELSKYRDHVVHSGYDILYPEKELEALQERDALELDQNLLQENKYKFVQVVRGKIERAFTADELKVGFRNPTTDIYNNGYPVAELELLVNLIASHLNTEFYNQAYFSQGFSAKGILHIKAPLNRRKLEMIRQQWQHMVKGARNSFQTPIFAGIDDVKWIPLTQNHSDIEFQGWLHYLIKMICAIYQIDPQEIGIGLREEGGKGGLAGGDNTEEKLQQSKDKGLYPFLRFLENYFTKAIIAKIDPDYCLEFVGLKEESHKEAIARQEKEAKFKKTVNEIRAEDGLPPLPGMDDVILGPEAIQWYTQFSKKALDNQQQTVQIQSDAQMEATQHSHDLDREAAEHEHDLEREAAEHDTSLQKDLIDSQPKEKTQKSLRKSKKPLVIEYYIGD